MNKESAMKAGQLLMGAESSIFTSDDVVEEIAEERNSRSKTRGPGEQWTREFFQGETETSSIIIIGNILMPAQQLTTND